MREFGASTITQTMRLASGSRRLEFDTEVDWHERHKFLKVAFPVDVLASRATYEIQYGHLERPTHTNTSWDVARFEVCAHRWADLSEPGYGVALLNDCKYGYDIHGNVMRLSLLRSPGWPDPESDQGGHRFSYALFPHAGDLRTAGVVAEAEAFNLPLNVIAVESGPGSMPARSSIVGVDRPNVTVEAVKMADREDAVVVRLCEVWGTRGPVRVTFDRPVQSAARTDVLEREVAALPVTDGYIDLDLRPFELVTLKLELARQLRAPANVTQTLLPDPIASTPQWSQSASTRTRPRPPSSAGTARRATFRSPASSSTRSSRSQPVPSSDSTGDECVHDRVRDELVGHQHHGFDRLLVDVPLAQGLRDEAPSLTQTRDVGGEVHECFAGRSHEPDAPSITNSLQTPLISSTRRHAADGFASSSWVPVASAWRFAASNSRTPEESMNVTAERSTRAVPLSSATSEASSCAKRPAEARSTSPATASTGVPACSDRA